MKSCGSGREPQLILNLDTTWGTGSSLHLGHFTAWERAHVLTDWVGPIVILDAVE